MATSLEQQLTDVHAMVERLTRQYDQLLQENHYLRKKMSQLVYTRSQLLAKNHEAAKTIKDIIAQLKRESA